MLVRAKAERGGSSTGRSLADSSRRAACLLRLLDEGRVDAVLPRLGDRLAEPRGVGAGDRRLQLLSCRVQIEDGSVSDARGEIRDAKDRGKIPAACVWQCACEAGLRHTQRPKGGRRAFSAASRFASASAFAFSAAALSAAAFSACRPRRAWEPKELGG